MKIAILTLGSRGDVQIYVALGKQAIEVYCNHFKAIERKTQWLVFKIFIVKEHLYQRLGI